MTTAEDLKRLFPSGIPKEVMCDAGALPRLLEPRGNMHYQMMAIQAAKDRGIPIIYVATEMDLDPKIAESYGVKLAEAIDIDPAEMDVALKMIEESDRIVGYNVSPAATELGTAVHKAIADHFKEDK
jgi:hypothetical protein